MKIKTILTKKRKQIIKEIRKSGFMTCWDEFALIPNIYEATLQQGKLQEVIL